MKGYHLVQEDTILQVIQELNQNREREYEDITEIPRIDHITPDQFFKEYMHPNRAVLIGADMTKEWKARREWVGGDGKPNIDKLVSIFGPNIVPVANCGKTLDGAQCKEDMTMKEYADWWKQYHTNEGTGDCLYLKDWHFVNVLPTYKAYTTPDIFREDWMNPEDGEVDNFDYRFVYLGPKGSFTPLHSDVLRTHSWSSNVCGRKYWYVYCPDQSWCLHNDEGDTIYDVRNVDLNKFPNFTKAKPLIVIQNPGETLFVPSGWYHQVINMEDTLSINHNWTNACSIDLMGAHLKNELQLVEKEIAEFKDVMDDWPAHCQLMLRALTGMNYVDYFRFIEKHVRVCLEAIRSEKTNRVPVWCHHQLVTTVSLLKEMLEDSTGAEALKHAQVDWSLVSTAAEALEKMSRDL